MIYFCFNFPLQIYLCETKREGKKRLNGIMVDIAPSSSKPTEESSIFVKGDKKIDYENWTKEQLIDKIRKLELHVFQLRNVIAKRKDSKQCIYEVERKRKREDGGGGEEQHNTGEDDNDNLSATNGRKVKKPRPFDFSL